MIVSKRRRRLTADRIVNDLAVGDMARRVGHRGVGIIETVCDGGWVWIVWKNNRKDYLPVVALRRVQPGGHEYDARKRGDR